MNYLVAVLSDRIAAEEAYTALEKESLPMAQITILGKGYKNADDFGLIDPNLQALKQVKQFAYWLIPFGFVSGYTFNVLTAIEVFSWAGSLGNHIIGGVFGAIAGAMGSFFVGGGAGLAFASGDALPYRNRLNQGKYLIVVKGSEVLTQQATRIIRKFEPETLQGYADPSSF
ncbi:MULTISPECIES: hypothetical protein [unclassified Coleofasciculus]|uniref:hypothetical protein n=1 Tax=unclassified Coleofasciculus TaxID=2692782 RepID=UPI001882C1BF|nr:MULTISPECIES: hypothetical protein [unclassified Coleofasciculus]MBE9127966.1 hypothetical protein [Coleofasciculus sp. LEGE 07081]MBE9149855.1 hypothetical protein [Coleofasciculus sp. LEGE 07092]